jgi:hypothetical protein
MKREQKITLGRGPARESNSLRLAVSTTGERGNDRVQSLHSKDWLTQALRHVHLT